MIEIVPSADPALPHTLPVTRFTGGGTGGWRVTSIETIVGEALPQGDFVAIDGTAPGLWTISGSASHLRYTTAGERRRLRARHAALGRPEARRAALIPIRKAAVWWDMAQDERRAVYERGGHLSIGLDYLPGIARSLYHARDLGEPFDFLTWFEFAPDQETAFDAMLVRLRRCAEWDYVDREIDIRMDRVD